MEKQVKPVVASAVSKAGSLLALGLVAALSFPHAADAARRPQRSVEERAGTLSVTIDIDGAGTWRHPKNGAYSEMKFQRKLSYTVPLKGRYSPASGFRDVDKREQGGGMLMPNLNRYLVFQPRDMLVFAGPAGRKCGTGSAEILDEAHGMAEGDPGQPPLVPFTQTVKGGGAFPSGDPTVPERDLCETAVSIDYDKHVVHLRLDGSDSHVKVRRVYNGHENRPYNLPLQGYNSDGSVKKKLTFYDVQIPDSGNAVEGSTVIEAFNVESSPDPAITFPLRATVKWRVSLDN